MPGCTTTDLPLLGCIEPWCAVVRDGLAHVSHPNGCALSYALASHAGAPVPVGEPTTWCAECGIDHRAVSDETWTRGWDGRPICGECAQDLEWDALLNAFHTMRASRSCASRRDP